MTEILGGDKRLFPAEGKEHLPSPAHSEKDKKESNTAEKKFTTKYRLLAFTVHVTVP